jgi:glycosyltransferase involved in cell wall biosynthesis
MNFSVLMSVYSKDDPDYFLDALASIWDKQSLKPSQIVLVVDGPISNKLQSVINLYVDKLGDLFDVVYNDRNLGLAKSLNVGLEICKFPFVARMDSDDISLPNRFDLQFNFIKKNPDIDCLGASIVEYNFDLSIEYSKISKPLTHLEVVEYSKLRCPFNHPTVVFKKDSVINAGGYPNIFPEDYILWINLILNNSKLANIGDVVLKMRTGNDFLRRRGFSNSIGLIKTFKYMYDKNYIGFFNFIFGSLLHFLVRISPTGLKKYFYRNFR